MTNEPPAGAPFELERFELVLLKRPRGHADISDAEADRLQEQHITHLGTMAAAGHLVVAGPFDEQPDASLRGLCLYQTGSLERARELAEGDPAVRAGRFELDVMYFYCEKGAVRRPHLRDAATTSSVG